MKTNVLKCVKPVTTRRKLKHCVQAELFCFYFVYHKLNFCFKFCFENNDVWNDCGNCLIRQRIVGIKILTWCQFPAGRHGTVSRKRRCSLWQNMENKSRGINMKLTAYLLLATFYSSAHACRACAFIQQEMEHLWFFFFKDNFFFLLQMIRRGNLAFLNPLHKACIFQPVGGFESRIFEIFFPNDCLKDWSGSHHRAYTFLNLDISCKWSMMAS